MHVLLVLGLAAAASAHQGERDTCALACAGLSCDAYSPETCKLLRSTYGCECDGCRCETPVARRLQASNETCPASCLVPGRTCDDATYAELGLTCADLENPNRAPR